MRLYFFTLFLTLTFQAAFSQSARKESEILQKLDELLFDSRYEEAVLLADQSTSKEVQVAVLIGNKKSEALIRQGKFDEANALLQQILAHINSSALGEPFTSITKSNIGFLYLNQGRNDLALEILVPASIALQHAGAALEAAQAFTYLGLVYLNTGKYVQAEEQQLMALSIRNDHLPEMHELIAASYNDLGLIYSRLDLDKALDNYEKATALYAKLHGEDHPKFAIANTNLGVVYLALALYGDAVNYFDTALKIWEKRSSQPNPSKAFVLRYLGETYSKMGNLSAGKEFYDKALHMYETVYGKKHPDVAFMHMVIGDVYQSENQYEAALNSYQQSLIANVSDFNSLDIAIHPTGKNFYSGTQLLYSLMSKAETLEARHLGKTLKLSDLTLGLTALQVCDSLIDRLRQQTTNEADKISLGTIASEIYADGVRISHLLSEVSFTNRYSYRELSFYFAEKSKSAVLQEAISDANAKSFANIPAHLLEEEKSLKAAMAMVNQKLAQKPSEEEEKYLRETAFHLNQSYVEFTQQLEQNFPDYFNLKFNSTLPSVKQIQELLDEYTGLLSYFIDENEEGSSRLYTYTITKKSFVIKDQAIPAEYDKFLSGYRNSLYFSSLNTFIPTSRSLYRLLIPKGLPTAINNLVILPAGRMSVIPFEALLTKAVSNAQAASFKNLPYLIKEYSIRYEFSAGLLLQKKISKEPLQITSARLLAPISFPEKDNLNNLPGTELEVNEIAKLLQTKNITCDVLISKQANETMVKEEDLKNFTLIHFATHGIVDEDNPELSRIFLQNDSEAEDGNLYSGEIYNLHLNANLVTLSACQTGLGKISKGEGVIGLSRALVYAGAKNLIVSFWSVADESTAEFMTRFYQILLQNQGRTFTTGLREAKLEMIGQDTYAAPYYWAPFILIGF